MEEEMTAEGFEVELQVTITCRDPAGKSMSVGNFGNVSFGVTDEPTMNEVALQLSRAVTKTINDVYASFSEAKYGPFTGNPVASKVEKEKIPKQEKKAQMY